MHDAVKSIIKMMHIKAQSTLIFTPWRRTILNWNFFFICIAEKVSLYDSNHYYAAKPQNISYIHCLISTKSFHLSLHVLGIRS